MWTSENCADPPPFRLHGLLLWLRRASSINPHTLACLAPDRNGLCELRITTHTSSYLEPIAGDENPETYGVPIASLHTDHVAADNTRIINYKYSVGQLQPSSRIPGFIFHQTERTADNGTNACFGSEKLCWDSNARDFDLLGYK